LLCLKAKGQTDNEGTTFAYLRFFMTLTREAVDKEIEKK
jgi:hypothetical protein